MPQTHPHMFCPQSRALGNANNNFNNNKINNNNNKQEGRGETIRSERNEEGKDTKEIDETKLKEWKKRKKREKDKTYVMPCTKVSEDSPIASHLPPHCYSPSKKKKTIIKKNISRVERKNEEW